MTSSSRTFKFTIFLLFSLVLTSVQLRADDADILTPTPPTVAAGSYILQDFRSGKILAENNADVK
ncbi:MAG: serine-type D-Ala-D-Ala carboxypeptidase, partial [Methylococcales bacterium]|nr:serine-type D-Ala-D-Ala carboxypeptidase [Methylococcales bacterium]